MFLPPFITLPLDIGFFRVGEVTPEKIFANGGVPPYKYYLIGGALPNGLTLGEDGCLNGYPIAAGSYNCKIRAVDANGAVGEGEIHQIMVYCKTPIIAPYSLRDGNVGQPYLDSISPSADSNNLPVTISIKSGALPLGLEMQIPGNMIHGIPKTAGVYSFQIIGADRFGYTATKDYVIQIK